MTQHDVKIAEACITLIAKEPLTPEATRLKVSFQEAMYICTLPPKMECAMKCQLCKQQILRDERHVIYKGYVYHEECLSSYSNTRPSAAAIIIGCICYVAIIVLILP